MAPLVRFQAVVKSNLGYSVEELKLWVPWKIYHIFQVVFQQRLIHSWLVLPVFLQSPHHVCTELVQNRKSRDETCFFRWRRRGRLSYFGKNVNTLRQKGTSALSTDSVTAQTIHPGTDDLKPTLWEWAVSCKLHIIQFLLDYLKKNKKKTSKPTSKQTK